MHPEIHFKITKSADLKKKNWHQYNGKKESNKENLVFKSTYYEQSVNNVL